ncbi:MAG: hypothetical protein PHU63_01275 [Candidatus ainarchaeum sp.]|nr:hypothetical protein [Candidatus ainarchaeum sp.]
MTEFRKSIRCSNCGLESSFTIGSEFILNELTMHAKCSRCGSSIQVTFSIINTEEPQAKIEETQMEKTVNLEEELFSPDMLGGSDGDIRDIIEGA